MAGAAESNQGFAANPGPEPCDLVMHDVTKSHLRNNGLLRRILVASFGNLIVLRSASRQHHIRLCTHSRILWQISEAMR